MQIITAPHPTLRHKAKIVTRLDAGLRKFTKNLGQTLMHKTNPSGVGLAAPQVNELKTVFATYVPSGLTHQQQIRIFINPELIDHSELMIVGETKNSSKPREEGCLSIPRFYGVVPRWEWVKFAYQLIEGDQLVGKTEVFHNFAARVMQHEYDHLFGILFTDRCIEHNLPVYEEILPDKWVEVDKQRLAKF